MVAFPWCVAASWLVAAAGPLAEKTFTLDSAAEIVATLHAGCERCDWGVAGREAAAVTIAVDGRYRVHVMLTRGERDAEYRVLLGRYARGTHRVAVTSDPSATARDVGAVHVSRVDVASIGDNDPSFEALAHAPVLHARPNTIGRFTDVPLLMWYETGPTPRGRSYRYSVIFSNEDGGTATDRLMATWGRTTDIEFVYGVELDTHGRTIAEEFQGPDHVVTPFRGRHENRHPLEFVVTDNNMVGDRPPSLKRRRAGGGKSDVRYGPAPELFDLTNQSREVVMDAHPWTYRVAGAEMIREGKIADDAAAGSGKIPDPRRFVFVEACAELEGAALAFGVRVTGPDGPRWFDSHRERNQFRIVRTGCFRGAVPLAGDSAIPKPDAIRFRAWPQADPKTERPRVRVVRVVRVNRIFTLDDDFLPRPMPFSWTGSLMLTLDGTPAELPF
ncbi:MAG TPA: hypothetical protein VGQ16_10250 [Vicinamibacterales bacterium]|nr:hypothetical protein [Vicinamibacterales bacterium]